MFANDQALAEELIAAGRTQGEGLWQLPLVPEYRDDLKSAVADLKNVGGGNAGSITGALFLQEFVGATRWAHLDVAGPAFADKDRPYIPRGGTGFGVRTLIRYLQNAAGTADAALGSHGSRAGGPADVSPAKAGGEGRRRQRPTRSGRRR